MVSWSASDATSGIAGYTVEYSRTSDSGWQLWIPYTTATSALFTGAIQGEDYIFRVTAYDHAGNSAQAQRVTYVGDFVVLLPLVLNQWVAWYEYDVYEPNDAPEQAYGPLTIGETYSSYIWNEEDTSDYYHFESATSADVRVTLTHIPPNTDLDLYIYYYNGGYILEKDMYSNRSGTVDEQVTFKPVAGRTYFVRVYPYSGFDSENAYRLTVVYD